MFTLTLLRNIAITLLLGAVLSACNSDSPTPSQPEEPAPESETIVQMGSGVNAAFVPDQAKVENADLDYNGSTTISVSLVDEQNAPVSEQYSVTFSSTCSAKDMAVFDNLVVNTSAGVASSVYTAQGCEGEDVVTVTATVGDTELTATTTLTIAALVKMGTGVNDAFVPGRAKVEKAQLQYGASTTISVSLVDKQNTPISEEYSVKFSSDCFADNLAVFDNPIVSTTAGVASAVYTAQGCEGEDVVTVTATVGSAELTATATLTITEAQVLSIEGVSVEYPQLQLAGMGARETSRVTFRVLGPDSTPLVGQEVRFAPSLSRGGIEILQDYRTAVTDTEGLVTTVLKSGTVVTSVRVIATHTASSVFGQSEAITISTGIPVQKGFALAADVYNPPGAFDHQGIPVKFSVILSDQFGHSVPDGTKVTFVSPETGNIGDGACEVQGGRCSITWISANSSTVEDGRVTVFAYVEGAELYTDNNANYVFDSEDTFNASEDDLSEAYADLNEDYMHNPGEFLIEAESTANGVYDDGDGEWNGPCMTGVNPVAICPAENKRSVILSKQIVLVLSENFVEIKSDGTFGATGSTHDLSTESEKILSGLVLADSNGNSLPNGTKVSFLVEGSGEGLSLKGTTSFTVKNNEIEPNGPYSVTLQADDTLDGINDLILRVKVPGEDVDQDFIWEVRY